MNASSRQRALLRPAAFALCALAGAGLLLWAEAAMDAAAEALRLCGETLIPSLFPFLACAGLLTALLPAAALERVLAPLSRPLFRLSGPGAAALLLGLVGGYPVGARTAAALFRSGQIGRAEAERLLAFCNNSGPGFLLGVVGVGVFGSAGAGMRLYAVHIAAALLVGLVFRFYGGATEPPVRASAPRRAPAADARPLPQLFIEAVSGALGATLNVCAFVLFFMVAVRLLAQTGLLHLCAAALEAFFAPFGMTERLSTALLAGLLELSTGAACLQGTPLSPGTAALAALLLGWGGVSVHCQSLLFLQEAGLSSRTYFTGKALQGLFSAALAFALFSCFPCP